MKVREIRWERESVDGRPIQWTEDEGFGYFIGEADFRNVREDGPDRRVRLLADFTFVDPKGFWWTAPKDSVVDGSSIPRLFWRIRNPYIGDHKYASIPHDVECDRRIYSWQAVHRMFYEAMRAAGEPAYSAIPMYWLVRYFGPRWFWLRGQDTAMTQLRWWHWVARAFCALKCWGYVAAAWLGGPKW